MKTLIAYASKSGTAEKCAHRLAEMIPDSTVVDLAVEQPDPAGYDRVIVGGGIRMSKLRVDAVIYLEGAEEYLLKKPLGLFICCGNDEAAEQLFEQNVPKGLLEHAAVKMSFGGEFVPEKARGLEKLFVRAMAKGIAKDPDSAPKFYPERIGEFAAEFIDRTKENA